ncbi:MAG: VOC family protein [Acidobacteria bacterium]|nr:VOC family protein [Acidobacteriota bacterium]
MNRIVHFEIPADDPEKIAAFYSGLFGWKIDKWDGPMEYWNVVTGENAPGINGGILRRKHPQQPPVNTVDVENIDSMALRVAEAGGQVVVPKMPIPGYAWLCYCKDPDGNIFGLFQLDPNAA